MSTLIIPFQGLGDEIYQRAFVKKVSPAYIKTPWPQLYSDIPGIQFIKPNTPLRTQRKNEDRQSSSIWVDNLPKFTKRINGGYRPGDNIINALSRRFGTDPDSFDLPPVGEPIFKGEYVVVRPTTIRTEREEGARNPDPQYVNEAATFLKNRGMRVISIGDVDGIAEKYVGPPPPCAERYDRGEFSVMELLNIISYAKAVIGGVGWIVPACLASGTPAWIICGGQGGRNHPDMLVPSDGEHKITFAVPENYCLCTDMVHDCDKTISDHLQKFSQWCSSTTFL